MQRPKRDSRHYSPCGGEGSLVGDAEGGPWCLAMMGMVSGDGAEVRGSLTARMTLCAQIACYSHLIFAIV